MVIIFKKDKKGSTEAEMCHAIVYAREFCLWDRYWGRTNLLWEHYFFSASSIPRKYLQILTGPSFVLTSKVANSFYQYSSSFSFSVPDINPIQTGGGGGFSNPPFGKIVTTPTPKKL